MMELSKETLEAVRKIVAKYAEVDVKWFNVNSVYRNLKGSYDRQDVAKALDQLAHRYSNMYKEWVVFNPNDPAQKFVFYKKNQVPKQVKFPYEDYELDVTDDITEIQYEIG